MFSLKFNLFKRMKKNKNLKITNVIIRKIYYYY